jgi:DNA-directed RNA polymerase specialized sigma24 family protein
VLKTTPLDGSTHAHSQPLEGNRVPALYRKFGPLIYSRCRRALNDEELALRATQEVFLRVLKSLDDRVEQGAVEVLSTACENVCRELRLV